MQKTLKYGLLGLSFILIFSACTKENLILHTSSPLTIKGSIQQLATQIKNWRDSVVSGNATTPGEASNIKANSTTKINGDILIQNIQWNAAYLNFDSSVKKSVIVPIDINYKTGDYLQLATSIVNDTINGLIIRTTPDSLYYATHKDFNEYSNYSGTVTIYTIQGKFLQKTFFKDGNKYLNNVSNIKNNETIKSLVSCFDCVHDLFDVVVSGKIIKVPPASLADIIQGYAGPSVRLGDMFVGRGVGSSGYGPSIFDPIKTKWLDEIDASGLDVNPCAKKVYENLKNSGTIFSVLKDFFEENPQSKLVFKIEVIYIPGTNEEVNGRTIRDSITGNFNIILNPNYLEKASPISIARTILHESLHAEMRYYLNTHAINTIFNEENLLFATNKYGNTDLGHNLMADFYRGIIIQALKQFDLNCGLNELDREFGFYEALSWGGLYKTQSWSNLVDTNKIALIIYNEENNGGCLNYLKPY